MKVRIISSLVASALLFFVMFMPLWVFLIALTCVAVIAVLEYMGSVRLKGYNVSLWPITVSAGLAVPLWICLLYLVHRIGISSEALILIWVIITFLASAATCIFTNMKYTFSDMAITVFGLLYVLLPLTLLVRIRSEQHGFYLIWLVFLGAWVTDISAYFAGTFFGQHKLIPAISSKKTVEGFIGGILGCMLAIVIYGMWMQTKNVWIPWYSYVFLGAVLGFVSQSGDWFASCIKRYLEIKDFGKIMPGHGGVLDRFDSILFAAPFVYIFILLF
ncbi:MAG: phosphatidate cytidylyltransferase [Clostridia bacterium]|jgi:phosphatidate cytidylyltransferase